jgi:alkylated DNA repair dioxygenase AlkB
VPHTVEWQSSLFALSEPAVDPTFAGMVRHQLDEHSWVDFLPNWLRGADDVFSGLLAAMPWSSRRVVMYDRILPEPRLSAWWTSAATEQFPLEICSEIRQLLSARYRREFDSIGCNYYRDGRDSVAWHGDKVPGAAQSPVVAIVSTGTRRPFLLRPTIGGHSIRFELGGGDLLVMGGRSQIDWQHCVPKVARSGPRISVTFRHDAPPPVQPRGSRRHE